MQTSINEETSMTDHAQEKTTLEKSRDIIVQLKDMIHYSKTNIEKLTEFWLLLEGEMKQKTMAKKFEVLLSHQNAFHDSVASVVSDYEEECDRMGKKPS
jgi:citrate synthase